MSPNPDSFLDHLRATGYHSRSNKHSNTLAEAIVYDLVEYCPRIKAKASARQIVYDLNFQLRAGTANWNVDLVLGPPQLAAQTEEVDRILQQRPSTVEVAIEIKAVMTEHRKAVQNRKRDLEAHHEHVHNYNSSTIAGGVLVINAAPSFKSPLRQGLTTHRNVQKLVEHCISQLRAVATRGASTRYGLEAKCAIVVEFDNVDLRAARYSASPLAPAVGRSATLRRLHSDHIEIQTSYSTVESKSGTPTQFLATSR